MGRRIVPVTPQTLRDLPQPCLGCAFWETGPSLTWFGARLSPDGSDAESVRRADAALKEEWVAATVAAWGPCGLIGYVDDRPAGYVLYAPPAFVPRAGAFPMSPIASDAVLLTAGRVLAQYAGAGLGRVLVQSAAKDLTRRGVRAIEAYGDTTGSAQPPAPPAQHAPAAVPEPPEPHEPPEPPEPHCRLPVGFLTAVGFVTVREHARQPRLRLDLRAAVSWRDPVEGALERMRGAVRPFPAGANRV